MTTSDVEISILLNGSQEIYHSGETVKGVVIARVHRFLRVAVIKVQFEGSYAFKYKHGGFHNQIITGNEANLDLDGNISDIQPGCYNCPFSFYLEQSLPSSLVSLAGSVEYKIIAKCGYKVSNDTDIVKVEAVQYFCVNRYLDLSEKPFALVGAQVKGTHKTAGWFYMCCGHDLNVSMETKKRAFVAGEKIQVSANIDNETSRIISKTELDVIQRVKTRLKYSARQKVVGKERGMVMNHSNQVWINESLLIPSVPPTSDDHNMSVSYILRMRLTLDYGKQVKLEMPIIIGNVPVDTKIIEGAGSELSFMYTGELIGENIVWGFIPSYIVYRFSPDAFPSAPMLEEPTGTSS